MIGEFERRIAELPEPLVQVTLAAMALGVDDATSERSRDWFNERVASCVAELKRRGATPGPLPYESQGPRGVPSHNRSLTQEQARQVRTCWEAGQPLADIANDFGVQEIVAWRIIKNETYRELPPPGPPDYLRTT